MYLDEMQKDAVMEAVRHGLMILTEDRGTGKTTTINAMIHFFEKRRTGHLSGSTDRKSSKAYDRSNRM